MTVTVIALHEDLGAANPPASWSGERRHEGPFGLDERGGRGGEFLAHGSVRR